VLNSAQVGQDVIVGDAIVIFAFIIVRLDSNYVIIEVLTILVLFLLDALAFGKELLKVFLLAIFNELWLRCHYVVTFIDNGKRATIWLLDCIETLNWLCELLAWLVWTPAAASDLVWASICSKSTSKGLLLLIWTIQFDQILVMVGHLSGLWWLSDLIEKYSIVLGNHFNGLIHKICRWSLAFELLESSFVCV